MRTVVMQVSISLDGYVADPARVGPLFDWYDNGEANRPTGNNRPSSRMRGASEPGSPPARTRARRAARRRGRAISSPRTAAESARRITRRSSRSSTASQVTVNPSSAIRSRNRYAGRPSLGPAPVPRRGGVCRCRARRIALTLARLAFPRAPHDQEGVGRVSGSQCGQRLAEEDRFCSSCGQRTGIGSESPAAAPPRPSVPAPRRIGRRWSGYAGDGAPRSAQALSVSWSSTT